METETPLRGTVPGSYVCLLYEYLSECDVDGLALLGTPPPESSAAARVPVAQWRALLLRAAEHLAAPDLGIRLGQRVTPAHFGLMGYVLLNCAHLGAAMARLHDYERLFYDVSPLHVRQQSGTLVLEWGTDNGRPGALVDDAAIAALIQLARDLTDRHDLVAQRIDFVNPLPIDVQAHARFFACPLRFAQNATRVLLPMEALDLPLRAPDPALLALLQDQAATLLRALPPRGDLGSRVRDVIASQLPDTPPHAENVAAALHCSERSLHRRLREQGTSFGALRDEALHQLACDALADPRLQLGDIAGLLGYSEQSAFTRAFRRWTGETPRAWRQRHTRQQ